MRVLQLHALQAVVPAEIGRRFRVTMFKAPLKHCQGSANLFIWLKVPELSFWLKLQVPARLAHCDALLVRSGGVKIRRRSCAGGDLRGLIRCGRSKDQIWSIPISLPSKGIWRFSGVSQKLPDCYNKNHLKLRKPNYEVRRF